MARLVFQSTPSYEGEQSAKATRESLNKFQSTPSYEGEHPHGVYTDSDCQFQSTPSYEGELANANTLIDPRGFNPRPRMRANVPTIGPMTQIPVSIHALV